MYQFVGNYVATLPVCKRYGCHGQFLYENDADMNVHGHKTPQGWLRIGLNADAQAIVNEANDCDLSCLGVVLPVVERKLAVLNKVRTGR
jgi:hypothetical protein